MSTMQASYNPEASSTSTSMRHPARLGIIGGGQLARMTAMAALQLGVEVVVLASDPEGPATRLSPNRVIGDWADRDTLMQFAQQCDVITLENEFVDASALEMLEQAGHTVLPGAKCIAITQDKFTQKTVLQNAGLPVPTFRAVESPEEILTAGTELGWQLILKTRRNGYDGKGNYTLRSGSDIEAGWRKLGGNTNDLMVEGLFPFVKELATIVTRGPDGAMVVYPIVETIQYNHVCHIVKAPAQIPDNLKIRASTIAKQAVLAVEGVGSFGVEMFLSANGELVINELAPRVHNSGHYTMEACICSQFENHVRAVLGWPLGNPQMISPAAAMVNLLGTATASGNPERLVTALRTNNAKIHLYGKSMSGPGRKMGHITALEDSVDKAQAVAEGAAKLITFGTNEK